MPGTQQKRPPKGPSIEHSIRINATKSHDGDGSNGGYGHRRNPSRHSSNGNAKLLPHRPSLGFVRPLNRM
jgi:hypothetical protein